MKNIFFFIIILLPLLTGIVCLQLYLSKKKNKWLGLILPVLNFIYSLIVILGDVISENISGWDIFRLLLLIFILYNIPTIILSAIYLICREKIKRNDELQKMNIQDLV